MPIGRAELRPNPRGMGVSREIGVRMALGARAGQVLGEVLERGLKLAAWGLLVGIILALAATRVLGSFLVGVSSTDPTTFVSVVAVESSYRVEYGRTAVLFKTALTR